MGGYGSGVSGWKPKSELAIKIDIRQMKRNGSLKIGVTSTNRFSCGDAFLAELSMTCWGNKIIVHTKPEQHITLTSTSCNYGGQRPWFLCPGCNRQAAILYQVSDSLSCSRCSDITYYSRNESPLDRMLRKKNKLHKRLSEGDVWGLGFFSKPKRMHQNTYDRLLNEFLEVDGQIDIQMEVQFGDLI